MFCRKFILLLVLSIYSNAFSAGYSQAILQNVMRTAVSRQVGFLPHYPKSLAEFIQYSKKHRALDWAVFSQLSKNDLGITLTSQLDYLARSATKVDSVSKNSEIASFYYPIVFPYEQIKVQQFSMPKIGNASSELAAMINEFGLRAHNLGQAPLFHVESIAGAGRVYFTVAPVSRESALIDYVDMRERVKDLTRQLIAQDPQLNIKYQQAAYEIATRLKSMVLASDPAEMIKAQFSINDLNLIDLFDEGYILNNEIVPQLQNYIYRNGYGHPAFTSAQRGELLDIIAPYFKYLSRTLNKPEIYSSFLNECSAANIPGTDILLQRLHRTNSFSDKAYRWFSSWQSIPRAIDEKIAHCQFFKDFSALEQLCKSGQFDKSRAMVDSYLERMKTAQDGKTALLMANEMQALYLTHYHYYNRIFNKYGIRYEHTDDPYYAVAKQLLESCPTAQKDELLATVQETISLRQLKLQSLFNDLKTDGKNPVVRAFAYRLIDAQSPQEIAQILAPLTADHPEEDMRVAYGVFSDKNLPKLISHTRDQSNFNPCSIASEEKQLPQCITPDHKTETYAGELIGNDFESKFKESLPSLQTEQQVFGCGANEQEETIDLDKIPQCNWGKQEQLPSLGEPVEASKENPKTDTREVKVKEVQAEGALEKEFEKIKEATNQIAKEYGNEYAKRIIEEALSVFPAQEYNLKKYKNYFERLEQLIKDLAKIRSNPRWSKFTEDPAKGNKISLNVIDEAIAGIACEQEKLVGKLERSEHDGEEFIEVLENGLQIAWDVKTFQTYTPDGKKYIFDAEKYVDKVKKGLMSQENIIINIAYLPNLEMYELADKIVCSLTNEDLKKIIGIDPYHTNRTREFNKYLNTLGRKNECAY